MIASVFTAQQGSAQRSQQGCGSAEASPSRMAETDDTGTLIHDFVDTIRHDGIDQSTWRAVRCQPTECDYFDSITEREKKDSDAVSENNVKKQSEG